jgi:methylase of polypeptide subunit release factors
MIKPLISAAFGMIGYDPPRKTVRKFTISGITYEADPASVGRTPQGESTAEGAIRMIRERGMRDLRVLDICCGVGIIGLTIFTRLRDEQLVRSIGLVDLNIFNLNVLDRALKRNGLSKSIGSEINFWLSNGLTNIPANEKFDLIISNPPHFPHGDYTSDRFSPDVLGTFDANWSFHANFYARCHEHLTPNGEVWFLENGEAAKEGDLLPFIAANPRLRYVGQRNEPLLPKCFWMLSARSPVE